MPTYIALLRAVNLGGDSTISMARLREALTARGHHGVTTVLQSGNVVLSSPERRPERLATRLANEVEADFGFAAEFFVRSAPEWRTLREANPFPEEAKTDPARLHAVVLRDLPASERWAELVAGIRGPERVRGVDRTAYVYYPDGAGRSKLTLAVIERRLGTRGTARNWNTVGRLDALAAGSSV